MKEMKAFKVGKYEGYTRIHIILVSLKGHAITREKESQNSDAEQSREEERNWVQGFPWKESDIHSAPEVSAFYKQEPTAKVHFLSRAVIQALHSPRPPHPERSRSRLTLAFYCV